MCARGGATLASELRAEMMRLRALAEEAAELRTGAREAHYERLRTRIGELLKAMRLRRRRRLSRGCFAEAALLSSGRISRRTGAAAHAYRELCGDAGRSGELGKRLISAAGAEPRGNTMLSKTRAAIRDRATADHAGLEIKSEIERAREQVQNLE